MKRKIALASTVSALLVLAAFIAICCIQTAVVESALKGANPNNKIENASVGFFSTKLSGLEIELQDGSKLSAGNVEINHEFLPFCLLFKKLNIENLKISGAVFEQKEEEPARECAGAAENSETSLPAAALQTPPEKPRNFEAAKTEAQKAENGSGFFGGFDLSVKNLEADIECRLRGGAKIKSKIGGENPARNIASSDIFKLRSAELSIPAEIECGGEKFDVSAQILARGTPQKSSLEAKIELEGKTIFQAKMNASDFYKKIEIQAQVLLNSKDFKSLAEGLPQTSLNLLSSASFDASLNSAECKISTRADIENLREFSVYFDDVNTSSIAAEISLSKRGGEISAQKFAAGLSVNGAPAFSVDCAKDFKLDLSDISRFPDAPLFALNLNRFDLGLLNAFIKQNGFEISAAPVSGSIEISKNGKNIEAKSKNLIPVKNLSLNRNGAPVISNASFNLFASGSTDFKKSEAALQISPIKNDSDFVGTLEFSSKSGAKTIRLQTGGNPSQLFPRAKECGVEKAEANALVLIKGDTANIKNLAIDLSGKSGENILKAKVKNEISLSLAPFGAGAQNAEIEISSENLPAEILNALCPGASAEKIGFFANVKIAASKSASSSFLASAQNFSYSRGGKDFLQNLNLELEGSAAFSDSRLEVEAKKFVVLENATGILTSSGSAVFGFDFSSPPVFKSGKFEAAASIPKMTQQPALKPFDNAQTGMLEISAAAENPEKIEAKIVASNLSARGCADVLDKASLDVGASLKDFSPQKASAKFRIATTRGETLARASAEISDEISAKIDAEKIVFEDAQTLIEAFRNKLPIQTQKGKTKYLRPGILKNAKDLPDSRQIRSSIKKKLLPHEMPDEPEPAPEPENAPQDGAQIAEVKIEELPQLESSRAAWDFGKDAKVAVSARQVLKDGEKMLENLSGEIFIGKTSIKIPGASALFYGAAAEMSAEARFDGNSYSLKNTSLKIKKLPIESLLKKNGENKTLVEGKFDVRADFFASGKTPEDTLSRLRFNAEAETEGGSLHLIDKTSDAWEMASIGTGMLKLGGSLLGGKVREAGEVAEAMQLLADLDFSAASLSLSRGENLDIILSPAEIKARDAILKIRGTIAYAEGESIKDMPISFPIKLCSNSGRLSQILQKIGYPADESNTVSGPLFQITGTLSNPKNNIAEILRNAAKSVFNSKK